MTFIVLLTKSIVFDVLIRVKVIRVGNDFESTSHEKYVFFAGRPVDLSIIIYQLMQEQYRFIYVVNCTDHLVITSIISTYILVVKVPSLRERTSLFQTDQHIKLFFQKKIAIANSHSILFLKNLFFAAKREGLSLFSLGKAITDHQKTLDL